MVPLLKLFYGFTVRGPLPPDRGPVILAANHESMLDPLVLQAAVHNRRLTFLMTSDYYFLPLYNWYARTMRCIPVMEENLNRAALRSTLEVLEAGRAVGIFPQGAIQKRLDESESGMRGIALLAEKSQVPVIPARIRGTGQALPQGARFFRRSRIRVDFGQALTLKHGEGQSRHQALAGLTRQVMDAIRSL